MEGGGTLWGGGHYGGGDIMGGEHYGGGHCGGGDIMEGGTLWRGVDIMEGGGGGTRLLDIFPRISFTKH